jgi:hypothetical protein
VVAVRLGKFANFLIDQSRALCRFDPLLDGNRKQRPSETEFVAVGVN